MAKRSQLTEATRKYTAEAKLFELEQFSNCKLEIPRRGFNKDKETSKLPLRVHSKRLALSMQAQEAVEVLKV